MLTWQQPQGTMYGFRLVANRYGFPVDQNDGSILIDSSAFPGTSYADQQVVPGSYHYYGIYIKVAVMPDVWQRVAFAVCLAPAANGMGDRLFSLLPPYFRELQQDGDLTTDAAGNQYLKQYLDVIGWGADYLKTQYDILLKHLNDPMFIPLGDLVNLAGQMGMPFQPEVPAHIMRKALANWTHVCRLRGTPGGLSENITLLTGYPVDLQSGRNKMLENDQSGPLAPAAAAWDVSTGYVLNEMVSYGSYVYKCIATGGVGNAPTGSTSANTWWAVQQNVTDPYATLANPNTVGGINTWQALYPSLDSGGSYATPAGTLAGTIGLVDPLNGSNFQHNAFSVFNKAGSTQDVMLRSVSQVAADRTGSNANMTPDPMQAAADGVPIPRISTDTNGWLPAKRYATNEIVLYDGMLFQALRASAGALPPSPGTPLNANPYFETTVSPWTATNGSAITQSSAQAFQGSHSMSITPNGTSAGPGAQSEQISVIPNATYQVSAWTYITAGYSSAQIGVNWFDAFGQYVSSSFDAPVTVPAAAWTQVSNNITAPSGAATGQLVVQLTGTPSGSVVAWWDAVTLACWQTPEWAALSRDERPRMMLSGYLDGPGGTVQVVPFVEWYDESGTLITSNGLARVTARTATPGTPGITPGLTYDSFNLGQVTYLDGRPTDTRDQNWAVKTGDWTVSGFSNGSAYPSVAGTRSVATVTSLATGIWLGVTFGSTVPGGTDAGLVFRMVDLTSYWRAGMSGLYKVSGSSASLAGSYSTACQPGDRLSVNLNGNIITVYRNGVQVLSTTDSYNASATIHGIACELVTI